MDEPDSRFQLLLASQSTTADRCFICATTLTPDNRSKEHVIPRWVQSRYSLRDQTINLLNETTIPYRSLVVSCCRPCNNDHLQPLETQVSEATLAGASAVRALGRHTLFLWLAKIYYGLLHREIFLPLDRRDRGGPTIADTDMLAQFRFLFALLQAVRLDIEIEPLPASLFVYDTLAPDAPELQWDFRDSLHTTFIAVRMGTVGIAAVLEDAGAQQAAMDAHAERLLRPLHPMQHVELAAHVFYTSIRQQRTPRFMTMETEGKIVVNQLPFGGSLRDWSAAEFGAILQRYLNCPLEQVYNSELDQVYTWLYNEDASQKVLDFDIMPIERRRPA